MPQAYDKAVTNVGTPSQQRQSLGYVPRRSVTGKSGGGVTVIEGSGTIELTPIPSGTVLGNITGADAEPGPIDYTRVTFGVGAPGTAGVIEGDLYFDTTLVIYVGYVWHLGAWNQF